jgi:hypothetical protein
MVITPLNDGFSEEKSVRYLILRVPETGDSEGDFKSATKVRAVYEDLGDGTFKLLTMFPDF